MRRELLFALLAAASATPTLPCAGQEFVPVHESAFGESEQEALQKAYYAAFERALARATAEQSAGQVGAKFQSDFTRDFDAFKSRYFTSDTDDHCAHQDNGRYLCEIDGAFKLAPLRLDLQNILGNEHPGAKHLTFALTADKTADRRKQYVVDQLGGAFAIYGLRILMDSASNGRLAANKVDFALGVYEITFSNLDDPGAYDPYNLRLMGTLSVRFRVTLLRTGETLRADPVTVSDSEAGPYPAGLKDKLMANLGKQAADKIARNVNAVVAAYRAQGDPNNKK